MSNENPSLKNPDQPIDEMACDAPRVDTSPADRFWSVGEGFEAIPITIGSPERPLELLEKLGPSPFERGGFPLIGFLATTYDKVSRFAIERGQEMTGR